MWCSSEFNVSQIDQCRCLEESGLMSIKQTWLSLLLQNLFKASTSARQGRAGQQVGELRKEDNDPEDCWLHVCWERERKDPAGDFVSWRLLVNMTFEVNLFMMGPDQFVTWVIDRTYEITTRLIKWVFSQEFCRYIKKHHLHYLPSTRSWRCLEGSGHLESYSNLTYKYLKDTGGK